MKRALFACVGLLCVALACSFGRSSGVGTPSATPAAPSPSATPPARSERHCGDGICDGPENESLCPQDCAPTAELPLSTALPEATAQPSSVPFGILFHLAEHTTMSAPVGESDCHMLNFLRFLDAGYIHPDGTGLVSLKLRDHPTSKVTARTIDQYFYVSTPNDPVMESFGIQMPNWDVESQTLWAADLERGEPLQITTPTGERFPGDVAASPGNAYVVYPFTVRPDASEDGPIGMSPKFDPFRSDSTLVVWRSADGRETAVLPDQINRQLFASFADFSADGATFFTLSRADERFTFVTVDLDSGTVTDFATRYPQLNWAGLDWAAFFPRSGDMAYAYFAISPDETRLIAYKNFYVTDTEYVCAPVASHTLWIFDLEHGTLEQYRDRPGSVSDASWRGDSRTLALAVNSHGGCYPEYLDASIELYNSDGKPLATLVTEPHSKITTLGWSPDGALIAYDVYSTDLVGRLKTVDTATQQVKELVNTQQLGYPLASHTNPVTLLFANWVVEGTTEGQ